MRLFIHENRSHLRKATRKGSNEAVLRECQI